VADKNDPTIEICKNYANTTCYHLTKKAHSKGETLKEILHALGAAGKHYDGYFILDADNVILPDFIQLMHDGLCAGNDVVLGARMNKTPSGNWVNCGSTLTWAYLNTLNNKCRSENGQNILVQGSPLLVSKTIIEDFWHNDWPLTSLTEDYELGFVCSINDFKTYYYEYAKAYDEQPHTYKQSKNQRLRWIKGHNGVDKKYLLKFKKTKCKYNRGIYKYDAICALLAPIILVASARVFAIYSLVVAIWMGAIGNPLAINATIGLFATILGSYVVLALWSLFAIIVDKKMLSLSFWQRLRATLTVPLFFASYLPIYIKSIFCKNVTWKKVAHVQSVGEKQNTAKKASKNK
jgi:cellulose synthase/poly-beta-1,6-N-acetylglucosamine synthase-like glycosyltransferase